MLIEMRTYNLIPGKLSEFLRIYESEGMATQREILGNMLGYFHTEIGPLNQIVHMWGYETFEDRSNRRKKLQANPIWSACLPKLTALIHAQETKILVGASFSPIK
jgi:NIPSNAP